MMVNKLTNVDFILLYLLAHGGRARRKDIMEACNAWRRDQGNLLPLAAIYFARYKRQSPYYAFDAKASTLKSVSSGMGRSVPDAKVAVWKLTLDGECRAHLLRKVIAAKAVQSICS